MADSPDTSGAESSASPSLGSILTDAREGAGFGIEQLAGQLHLDPAVLRALEAEDFSSLGAPVYVRGHLKALARILEMDPQPLLNAYEQLVPAETDVMVSRGPQPPKPPSGNPLLWLLVLLAVLLGGFFGYWLVSGSDSGSASVNGLQDGPALAAIHATAKQTPGD